MKRILLAFMLVQCILLYAEEPTTNRQPSVAIKTNLLYDAVAVPNLGAEFYLGKSWTVAATWNGAWWCNHSRDRVWRYSGAELALNRWFGRASLDRRFSGHHAGIFAQCFTFDFALGKEGYLGGKPGGNSLQSPCYAFGADYGYSLPIGRSLNLDFSLGVGYMGGKYYKYRHIDDCFVWQATKRRKWVGPVKAEISLVWVVGRNSGKEGGRL
jgi:hypothetical protein